MPTWNHLWFVAYLWVYTLLLGTIAIALGQRFDKLAQRLSALLTGWKLLILPIALLALIRMALAARFPTTHNLVYDWHNHAISFSMFLLGAMLARERGVWARMDALRWTALGGALACWATLVIFFSLPEKLIYDPIHNDWRVLMRVVYAACTWCAIVAACGFAHRHLNFDSPKRRYLATAVFPVYILHQSLIVSIAHLIKPANIAPATEGPMLIVITLCISFAAVEVLRRCRPLQPLFGIDVRAASKAPAISLAEAAPRAA